MWLMLFAHGQDGLLHFKIDFFFFFANILWFFLNTHALKLRDGRHFDDVITRTRRRIQMGELVKIVANTPKFNFI